jgi:DedD protein
MKTGWSSFMDRRVKERLVGATILMVLAVLIVPELLSGPKHLVKASPPASSLAEPVRNVTVDLATNKAASTEETPASSAVSSSPDEESATATQEATPTIATLQAQQPASAASPPIENGPSVPTSTATTSGAAPMHAPASHEVQADAAHHRWAAQIGSFANRANAEKLERQLKAQGYSAYIVPSGTGRSTRYRVRVGPMPDRSATERVIAKLNKAGHSASVVTP